MPATDLLLRNVRLRTGAGLECLTPGAIAVGDGTILAAGPAAEAEAWAGSETEVLDLDGALVLPGFVDAHTHLGWAGEAYWRVNWQDDVRDRATALERLAIATLRVEPGFWLLGGGWSRDVLTDAELPTLAELDRLTGDLPAFLASEDATLALANSRALALLRVEPHTSAPLGGEIERDANGHPTGRLLGAAARARMTLGVVPPPDRYRRRAELRAALRELARHGVTEAHDIATFPDPGPTPPVHRERSFTDATLFDDLAERDELTARVDVRPYLGRWQDIACELSGRGRNRGLLSCRGLKELLDDGRFSAPDADAGYEFRYPGHETALEWMRGADRARLSVTLHALGDLAVSEALDLFEAIATTEPAWPRRPRLVHARRIAPEDFDRIARLGVVVEAQPWDLADRMPAMMSQGMDEAFLATAFPFRALLDRGVRVAFSSDWRISPHRPDLMDMDPLVGMYVAATRTSPLGGGATWQPAQRITVAEAIACYTVAPAWATGAEHRRGSIRPGNDADLVALSRDVVGEGPESLLETKALLTLVAGRSVHRVL